MKKYRVVFADLNGAMRGKIISEESFDEKDNLKMTRSALVADITGDEVSDLPDFDIQTGDIDMLLKPDVSTLINLPNSADTVQVIVDTADTDGTPIGVAPRNMLKAILKKYQASGLEARVSTELEFYLFHSSGRQLNSKELDMPYASINSLHQYEKFLDAAVDMTRQIGLSPEMVLSESGQGQFELTFAPAEPLYMADRSSFFKQMIKEIARDQGLMATFLAKPFEEDSGSGGHVHLSLHKNGKNAFLEPGLLENFVAGQLYYMRSLMLIFAPNPNSYRRLESGHGYTPETVSYGEETRTVGVRMLGSEENRRIEHRVSGADNNVYLVLSAILAAGLKGIEEGWTYDNEKISREVDQSLPKTFREALEAFESGNASQVLGKDFVRVFSATKEQELQLFENAGLDKEVEAYGQQV